MTLLQKILPREIRNRVASLASLSRTLLSALKVPYPRKRTVLGQPCWLITLKWAFSFSYCLQQTRAHSSRPGATGASSALLESGVQPPGVMMNFCITRKRTGSTFSPYHTPTTQAQWEEGGVAPTSQEIAAMLLHMWRRASAQFPPPPHPPAHRVLSGRSWRIKFSWIACGSCHSLLLPPVCQLCLAHLRPKPRPGCLDYRSRTAESAQGWPHPPGQRGCPLPYCLLPAARLSQALEPTCCQPDRASRRRAGNQAGVSLPEVTLCQTAGSSLSTSWAHFV